MEILGYTLSCVEGKQKKNRKVNIAGCGSVWLERLVWDQEVAGSNPVTPIFYSYEPGGGNVVSALSLFPQRSTGIPLIQRHTKQQEEKIEQEMGEN